MLKQRGYLPSGKDAVMQNLYAGNTGKLAAWNSASHIERAPQKAKPPEATPDN